MSKDASAAPSVEPIGAVGRGGAGPHATAGADPGADAPAPAFRDLSPRALRRWNYATRAWLGALWAVTVALMLGLMRRGTYDLLLLIAVAFAAMASVVLVHECGHWLAARWRGMSVAMVVIGPVELQPRRRGLRARLRVRSEARKGLGGWVVAFPDPRRRLRRDGLWLAAGGSLVNLAFAALCLIGGLLLEPSYLRSALWLIAAMNAGIGALNLMPYLVGGHTPSDGLILWRLAHNRYRDVPGATLKLLMGHLAAGLPAQALDPALLRRMAAEPEPMPLLADWLDFENALRGDDPTAIAAALARLREREAGYAPALRESIGDLVAVCELQDAFRRALDGEADAARSLAAFDLRRPGMWRAPHLAPRVRALSAALRGEAALARAELERSRRYADNDPVPGVAEYEAGLRERVAALIAPRPAAATAGAAP